ncbi:MAG TPA: hypothetical protein PLO33_10780 [Kouleothrix sp.]|uniref:hypothetical protein n=1 Tax=Kouleothrix sp. TaxID=2779161 RepID=UPI002B9932AC|nr:hypothetical protein [Kouleothrix sp.]
MASIVRIRRFAIALLVALAAISATVGSALAAAPATTPSAGQSALAQRYHTEQDRLKVQDLRLQRAADFAAKVDALVAKAKAKGKDTAALEAALASYRAAIVSARAEWQAASDALAAHAGFDAAGKVTDAAQALATVQSAHEHMAQAHTLAHGAFVAMRKALADFRKANRSLTQPQLPLEP